MKTFPFRAGVPAFPIDCGRRNFIPGRHPPPQELVQWKNADAQDDRYTDQHVHEDAEFFACILVSPISRAMVYTSSRRCRSSTRSARCVGASLARSEAAMRKRLARS
jgi:hypothetical protein